MARYTGATCRISRKYGKDFGFKVRDIESKCKFKVAPGQHGASRRGRPTDFGKQLQAKQQLRCTYNFISEKQFRNLYKEAARLKGATGTILLQLLERRLDTVLFRMGFAATKREARQLVSHKAVLVNGRVVNIASYRVQDGDEVSIREKARTQTRISDAINLAAQREIPAWLTVNHADFSGTFARVPERDELPQDIDEQLVVELYSK